MAPRPQRIFYVNVASMPGDKANAYVRTLMDIWNVTNERNPADYDTFVIPVREGESRVEYYVFD